MAARTAADRRNPQAGEIGDDFILKKAGATTREGLLQARRDKADLRKAQLRRRRMAEDGFFFQTKAQKGPVYSEYDFT